MIFASSDGGMVWFAILVILILSSLIQMWIAVKRPEIYQAQLREKQQRREERAKMLGTGAKIFTWWLTRGR